MKTHPQALLTGVLGVFFLAVSTVTGAEWAVDAEGAKAAALKGGKDILFVYTSPGMGGAGERWIKELNESAEVDKLLSGRFVLCRIELPEKVDMADKCMAGNLMMALKDGVGAVPTMVLADAQARSYAKLAGGVLGKREAVEKAKAIAELAKTREFRDHLMSPPSAPSGEREKSRRLLGVLYMVPPTAWLADYPDEVALLKKDHCRESGFKRGLEEAGRAEVQRRVLKTLAAMPSSPSVKDFDDAAAGFEAAAREPGLSPETRQFVLLACAYPCYVRKAYMLYDGTNNGELEEAFNRSVEVLERVRDMGKETRWGRQAHAVREELRKARLDAAKYD